MRKIAAPIALAFGLAFPNYVSAQDIGARVDQLERDIRRDDRVRDQIRASRANRAPDRVESDVQIRTAPTNRTRAPSSVPSTVTSPADRERVPSSR